MTLATRLDGQAGERWWGPEEGLLQPPHADEVHEAGAGQGSWPAGCATAGVTSRLYADWLPLKEDLHDIVLPQQEAATSIAEWVTEKGAAAAAAGCTVIAEPDPPPGAPTGHMAFGGFNPDAEKAQARMRGVVSPDASGCRLTGLAPMQAEGQSRAQGAAEEGDDEETAVLGAEQARRMGREDMSVKSMRMQKKARHK